MPQRGRRTADDLILTALSCGATQEAAAQKAGVSKATVQRRLKDPEFCQRLQELGTEMVKRVSSALTAASMEAIKTLLSLQATTIPHAVRLGAARSVLEMGIKLRESASWEERLAALEQLMASKQAG
jgi:hypothetical protein